MTSEPQFRDEALTRQFYAWENRGRGWQIFDAPVQIEPPFRPFVGHFTSPQVDDRRDEGRKATRLSTFFDRLKPAVSMPGKLPSEVEPEPEFVADDPPIVEIEVVMPAEAKTTKEASNQFLLSLGHVSRPISFEILGTHSSVQVQMACGKPEQRQVYEQLQAYFPDSSLTPRAGYLRDLWDETGRRAPAVVEFGLSKEFMRPLRSYDKFDPDPLAGVIAGMTDLAKDELALLQILFAPVRHPWSESLMKSVTNWDGEPFFEDDPSIIKAALEKTSTPLFSVVVRVACQGPSAKRAWRLAQGIGKAFHQFTDPLGNELIPLSNEGYEDDQHARDVVARHSCRSGALLNCGELISIVHMPSASARSSKLKRHDRKTKAAPGITFGSDLVLGENTHAGKTVRVTLSPEQRVRHMHLVGASGSGKSTLLLSMIDQDLRSGSGIAVLDPHGDLIEQILSHVPESRVHDVILLDPSDDAYPVGFNILSAHSEIERTLLASDLVSVFRRLSTSFGDQMNTVLANAIMALLESTEGGTLADLRRFLVEAGFRERFLQTVSDQEIVYYWRKEFPLLTGKPQGPILTRLDTFLRPRVIRHMVSQKENRIDFANVMNGRHILLAKLSQGLIGEENSYLLGTLLVSKLNQIAMSRQHMAAAARTPFYLYIDEFHNFMTPSLASILAGARKYGLGLVLAHQELHQLSNREGDVTSAVISNPYTRVCFRLGDFDAKKLQDGFSSFDAKDLQSLGIGEAIARMERAEYDFNLRTDQVPKIDATQAEQRRNAIVQVSRERYAMKREDVEALIRSNHESEDGTFPQKPTRAKSRTHVTSVPDQTMATIVDEPSPSPGLPGRGGEHHQYLQQLIRRWAVGRGYAVTIEKPILDGLGSVDVALEKDGRTIACEISVTTETRHEVGNVQKCLAAGFSEIVLVSSEKKVLSSVRQALAAGLDATQYRRLKFLTPEETFALLESLESAGVTTAPVDPNELLTAKELEEMLRIDVKTIYSYVQKGLIPYVKMQSNVRFLRSEILKWMQERQYKPGSRTKR